MSFYISLTGLHAAQTNLTTISNNVANAGSIGFKRSRADFGDIFSSAPKQTSRLVNGQGTKLNKISQQFTQGTIESTDKTLDLSINGEGFFVTQSPPPKNETAYTRNGAFDLDRERFVVDGLGNRVMLLPADTDGNITASTGADLLPFQIPANKTGEPDNLLVTITINERGVVGTTYADGTSEVLGVTALANFDNQNALRPVGDAHWLANRETGEPNYDGPLEGSLGAVRSGSIERANVNLTQELVSLITAQRNFQANAQAIETAGSLTQTIINLQI